MHNYIYEQQAALAGLGYLDSFLWLKAKQILDQVVALLCQLLLK